MTVFKEFQIGGGGPAGGGRSPFGGIAGLLSLALFMMLAFFLFKGIFWILNLVAPVLFIATLIMDYTVVTDFVKFLSKLVTSVMILTFFISIGLSIGYIYLLQWITDGWEATGSYKGGDSTIKVTVIIAARNEEISIAKCLKSIFQNQYPSNLLEIIVVDDQSEDKTASIIAEQYPQVKLLSTKKDSGKKAAIALATKEAQGELLLFTDADCTVPITWIQTMVANYDSDQVHFLAAPIQIDLLDTNLSRFQYLDVAATMAVTANGIQRQKYYSANGANMAVKKSTFLDLYDVRNDEKIASGDDMFTIHDKNIILVQGYVFLLVVAILGNVILGFMTDGLGVFTAVMMLFIKVTIDYLFLAHICKFFKKEEATKKYLIVLLFFR